MALELYPDTTVKCAATGPCGILFLTQEAGTLSVASQYILKDHYPWQKVARVEENRGTISSEPPYAMHKCLGACSVPELHRFLRVYLFA
jgi:hypothetical protein